MKEGHRKSATPTALPVGPRDFVRLAIILTAATALATLVVLPFQRGPEVAALAAALFGVFAAIICGVSIVVRLIVVIPPLVWRLVLRVVGPMKNPGGSVGVRDEWLDGPDPA